MVDLMEQIILTREQMASVLVRAFDLKPKSGVNVTINDLAKISASHVDDVKVLYQNGVTVGKANGVYAPKDGVTRAEFSVFMYRALMELPVPHPDDIKLRFQQMIKINHLKTTNLNQSKRKAINRIKMGRKKTYYISSYKDCIKDNKWNDSGSGQKW